MTLVDRDHFDGELSRQSGSSRSIPSAELKAVDPTDLEPLYQWADDLIGDLYSSPPPAAAQSVVEFSYEGFRTTLHQAGHAVFMNRSTDH